MSVFFASVILFLHYRRNELASHQDELLFQVTLLSRIHHRHLVTFLGYSQQDGKNILVYEFMHKGTLKEHLRGKSLPQAVNFFRGLLCRISSTLFVGWY
jgi:serine/threonine protein kinase